MEFISRVEIDTFSCVCEKWKKERRTKRRPLFPLFPPAAGGWTCDRCPGATGFSFFSLMAIHAAVDHDPLSRCVSPRSLSSFFRIMDARELDGERRELAGNSFFFSFLAIAAGNKQKEKRKSAESHRFAALPPFFS